MLIQFPMKTPKPKDEAALYAAIHELKSVDEVRRFMVDLCTPGGIADFAERWAIARLLNAGKKGYREIAAETGASTTTVGRVARFLFQERHQGYKTILDRLYPEQKTKELSHDPRRPAKTRQSRA